MLSESIFSSLLLASRLDTHTPLYRCVRCVPDYRPFVISSFHKLKLTVHPFSRLFSIESSQSGFSIALFFPFVGSSSAVTFISNTSIEGCLCRDDLVRFRHSYRHTSIEGCFRTVRTVSRVLRDDTITEQRRHYSLIAQPPCDQVC